MELAAAKGTAAPLEIEEIGSSARHGATEFLMNEDSKPGAGPSEVTVSRADTYTLKLLKIQPDLRAFIHYLAPYYDGQDDVVQEINLLLLEKRGRYKPEAKFKAWAFRFARNVLMNHLRRLRREREFVFQPETIDALIEEHDIPDGYWESRRIAFRECLSKLDPEDRDLLLSRYRSHGAVAEAAAADEVTASGLRTRLYRLRIALRRCIIGKLKREEIS